MMWALQAADYVMVPGNQVQFGGFTSGWDQGAKRE